MTSTLLQDKVVIITGASQGIGRGVAVGCAKAGAKVVVHHLGTAGTTKDAEELKAEIDTIRKEAGGEGQGAVLVAGDIAQPETADEVSFERAEGCRHALTES